jgi:Ca2+-binding RTX toxin-like protein
MTTAGAWNNTNTINSIFSAPGKGSIASLGGLSALKNGQTLLSWTRDGQVYISIQSEGLFVAGTTLGVGHDVEAVALSNGDFAATWTSGNTTYAQVFRQQGSIQGLQGTSDFQTIAAVSGPIVVSVATGGDQALASQIMPLASGGFVVGFAAASPNGSGYTISHQLNGYSAAGDLVASGPGAPTVIDSYAAPALTYQPFELFDLGNGKFVYQYPIAADGAGAQYRVVLGDYALGQSASAYPLILERIGAQNFSFAKMSNGNVVASWDEPASGGQAVKFQLYGADGSALTSILNADSPTNSSAHSDLAVTDDNSIVLTWFANGSTYFQVFDQTGNVSVATTSIGQTASPSEVTSIPGNGFQIATHGTTYPGDALAHPSGIYQTYFRDQTFFLADSAFSASGSTPATLVGTDQVDVIQGGYGADVLVGNAGDDRLSGGEGSDTLVGGAGADRMMGGSGNDVYYVDHWADAVIEFSGSASGTEDKVYSSVSYTLGANIEQLFLTDSATFGQGNRDANKIVGTSSGIEYLLIGGGGADVLIGNSGNDVIYGDAPAQAGGQGEDYQVIGSDQMFGGAGNDTYYVSDGDIVVEQANEGYDAVNADMFHQHAVLGTNIERLNMLGRTITGTGNESDNIIQGNDWGNIIDGGGGTNVLIGGRGNDDYIIRSASDFVVEQANEGYDTVYAYVNVFQLHDNIEQLRLMASNQPGSYNVGRGNSGDNTIIGSAGNDILLGDGGNDRLFSNGGNDIFMFQPGFGHDEIVDFRDGDLISIDHRLIANFEQLQHHFYQNGANLIISVDGTQSLTLSGVHVNTMDPWDFAFF